MVSVGETSTLQEWVAGASAERTLLLVGATSFRASGASERLRPLIERGAEVAVVSGPLPTTDEIDHLASTIKAVDVDEIAGIGGGLVIDSMKLAALVADAGVPSAQLVEGVPDLDHRHFRTIAIPTTAGSGAEKTPFAVVYRSGVKHSIDHPLVRPDVAFVEPNLTYSMPRSVAASSGLDAIAHCIESTWSIRSTSASRALALAALAPLWDDLETAVVDKDEEAMTSVALAASAAGEAIAVTRTTSAHAMSYYLTSRMGVAHGHAVALLLPEPMVRVANAHHGDVVDDRGPRHLREVMDDVVAVLGATDAQEAADSLRAMIQRLGLATSLGGTIDVGQWISEVNPARLSNNPVRLTQADLESMARRI